MKKLPKTWAKKLGDPNWKSRRTFTVNTDRDAVALIEASVPGRTEKEIVGRVDREWSLDEAERTAPNGASADEVVWLAGVIAAAQADEIASALQRVELKRAQDAARRAAKRNGATA